VLFLLPVGCLILAMGWVLYYFGAKRSSLEGSLVTLQPSPVSRISEAFLESSQ
jgi:hypothetical protein